MFSVTGISERFAGWVKVGMLPSTRCVAQGVRSSIGRFTFWTIVLQGAASWV